MEPLSTEPTEPDTDDKYIVFKRNEFYEMMGFLALPPWRDHATGQLVGVDMDCAPISAEIQKLAEERSLRDAVVIRRQDFFASPCLAGYSASIALALHLVDDPIKRKQLSQVADYFQRQSEIAADEGWKLPDV